MRSDGSLWAWGSNAQGQLEADGAANDRLIPIQVLAGVKYPGTTATTTTSWSTTTSNQTTYKQPDHHDHIDHDNDLAG